MSDDRGRGMLTEADRAHLRNEKEYRYDSNRLAADGRVRSRILEGLRDGGVIWARLQSEQREKIFSEWQSKGERVHEGGIWEGWDEDAKRARDRFQNNLVALLATVFRGVEQGDVMSRDQLIKSAITTAEGEQGRDVTGVTLDVEIGLDTEELRQRFEDGDPSLSMRELNHLRRECGISEEDRAEYRERAFGRRPIGNVGEDEEVPFLPEQDEDTDE